MTQFLASVQHFLSTVSQHKIRTTLNAFLVAELSNQLADSLLRVSRDQCSTEQPRYVTVNNHFHLSPDTNAREI